MNKPHFIPILFLVFGLTLVFPGTGEAARPDGAPALMSVILKPGPVDKDNRVGYIDVTIILKNIEAPGGTPLLRLQPVVYGMVGSVAKTLTNFEATDAGGALPMDVRDDPGNAAEPYRDWIPSRPVAGDLLVRYRAPVDPGPQTRSEVPVVLRAEGGGFVGAGSMFILMPAGVTSCPLAVRWDLAALGPGASAASSFGDGDVKLADSISLDDLASAFFMAGPMHRYPDRPAANGFSSAWLGSPPFDPVPLMVWTEKLHSYYRQFFRTETAKPYRVFLRFNPINPNGGVGLFNSFVATYDQNTTAKDLHLLLAHEMFHTFSPYLKDSPAKNGLDANQWFGEGLAVFYQRLLPWRAGLIDSEDFLEDLNETAAEYYTNLLNTTPNDQIAPRFWEDTRIRTLPYDRGSMYLAVVDAKVRKASNGRRSLDDLVLALLERERKGLVNNSQTWMELVAGELGQAGREEYEAILAGAVILPESDGFGPCFERRTVLLRRFDLGFDFSIWMKQPRVIQGLIPGSEAERAGLRDGDEIVQAPGLDAIQGGQKRTLTLHIRRDGRVFPVTYLPRGETVDAYQWVRVPGVLDSDCRWYTESSKEIMSGWERFT